MLCTERTHFDDFMRKPARFVALTACRPGLDNHVTVPHTSPQVCGKWLYSSQSSRRGGARCRPYRAWFENRREHGSQDNMVMAHQISSCYLLLKVLGHILVTVTKSKRTFNPSL
jgi:hypothetical protein